MRGGVVGDDLGGLTGNELGAYRHAALPCGVFGLGQHPREEGVLLALDVVALSE